MGRCLKDHLVRTKPKAKQRSHDDDRGLQPPILRHNSFVGKVADDERELHALASELGIPRRGFQRHWG